MANFILHELHQQKIKIQINLLTKQTKIKDNLNLLLKNKYSSRKIPKPCQNMTKI